MQIIDKTFREAPKSYILQSLMAVAAVAIILYFVSILTQAAIVVALGASSFIVFAMPNSISAQPRRIMGGHIVGLICGSICYYAFLTGPLGAISQNIISLPIIAYALSVGLATFLMTITNTEHPPAAGTALGVVVGGVSYQVVLFVLLFALGLSLIKKLAGRHLKDLA